MVTRLSGDVNETDIAQWQASLAQALDQIEDHSIFKMLIDLSGLQPSGVEAHKKFRTIIPLTLADYGWKVGYVHLFEEDAKSMKITNTRGVQCVGVAHSHHDKEKMDLYQARFAKDTEQFFSDPKEAHSWILKLK